MATVGSKLKVSIFIINICRGNKCTYICMYLRHVWLRKYGATNAKWVNDHGNPEAAKQRVQGKSRAANFLSAVHFVPCVSTCSSSLTRTTATAWSSMFCPVRELATFSSLMRTTGIFTPPAAWIGRRRPTTSSKPRWSTRGRDRSWSPRPSLPSSSTTSTITSLTSVRRSTREAFQSGPTSVRERLHGPFASQTNANEYHCSVTSTSMCVSGTSVIQVTATDADDGMYGNSAKLVYSISQGHPYFSVDPNTGTFQDHPPVCSGAHDTTRQFYLSAVKIR